MLLCALASFSSRSVIQAVRQLGYPTQHRGAMGAIFLSHSSKDNQLAARARATLAGFGHRSVFLDFDPADGIPGGRNWERELYARLRQARAVVALCAQPSYLRRHSALSRASSRQTGGNELKHAATLFPGRVVPIYLCHVRFPVLRAAPANVGARGGSVG